MTSIPLTNSNGAPLPDDQNSLSAGPNGPLLLQDYHLIDKLAHFNRERIPERVVHAKGSGAHGYFEVTNDVTMYTKAAVFSKIGKKTPVFLRFSTVGGEKGSADAERDPRGFAVKFYTEEGNWDLVGNNTPVFFIRDTIKFPDFIHTQKRNPQTNLKDANMFWDFLSLTPESTHQVSILFSDRGTPKNYRQMNGYGSHTFKLVNARGEACWCKFHFKTEQGIENFTREEAARMCMEDPDHAQRDLHENIARGNFPAWRLFFQIMTREQALDYRYDPFDVTKVWPQAEFPLIAVGRLVLDRNPSNYFADTEQAAFSPSNLVPGIEPSPDKMLQGRLFSYPDTHRHRLGPNFMQIPINCPYRTRINNYQRDGAMTVLTNGGSGVNYWPNSFGGPAPQPCLNEHAEPIPACALTRHKRTHPNSDFEQAGMLFRRVMTEEQRTNLIGNIVAHLGKAHVEIQKRQICNFARADPEYGRRVAAGLGLKVEFPARM